MAAEPTVDLKRPTEPAEKQAEKEDEKGLGNDAYVKGDDLMATVEEFQ